MNVLSEMMSSIARSGLSLNNDSGSDKDDGGKSDVEAKALKIRAFQTDVHIKEKLERAIDEKNPYRYS
jgi:hypothetical protein